MPGEQTGKIDVLRKILNSTDDQNSLSGKAWQLMSFLQGVGSGYQSILSPPTSLRTFRSPAPRVFPRGGYRYLESMRWDCCHFLGAQTETPVLNTKTVDEDPAGCQRWISRKEI